VTLADLLPSLRSSLYSRLEVGLWPITARCAPSGDVTVGGVSLTDVAARFGTPVHVLDTADVRARCRSYRCALPDAEIVYAGKAFLCRAMARLVEEEGLSLDVCSAGEVAVARAAGFPAERLVLHGNVKTAEDLKAALTAGVGRIVIDSVEEIQALSDLAVRPQRVLIRVTPGVDGHTHSAVTTGVEGSKFGFSLATGAALDAVAQVLACPALRLVGLHCHLGSQITGVSSFELATHRMTGLLAECARRYGIVLAELNLGGGHAIPYGAGAGEFDLPGFTRRVPIALGLECARHGIPRPRLTVEPGRAIVGRAGVTVYRVAVVKRVGDGRRIIAMDGGMSDNPRPALYGARYPVRVIGREVTVSLRPATVVGRHCESGDLLAEDVSLPDDVHAGDLLAVPCSGAYHHSMASNYNLVGRAPVVALADGRADMLVRRETEEDLLRRDVG
jgi:diaminopimelate decarboxylase